MKTGATAIGRILLVVLGSLLLLGCDNPIAYELGGRGIVKDYKDGKRDFWGEDVSGFHMVEAGLSMTNWRDGLLVETDLTGADLRDCVFTNADMRGIKLSNADLSWSNLYESDLRDADLSQANLTGVILIDADLEGANLAGANLTGANVKKLQWDKASSLQGTTLPDGSVHP